MAAIKSFSDLEQSKKLAEILPLESADMIYTMVNGYHTPFIRGETIEEMDEDDVCAWFRKVKEQECSFDGIDSFITHFKEAMKL